MLCLAVLPSLPGFHHRLHFCVCNECCQRAAAGAAYQDELAVLEWACTRPGLSRLSLGARLFRQYTPRQAVALAAAVSRATAANPGLCIEQDWSMYREIAQQLAGRRLHEQALPDSVPPPEPESAGSESDSDLCYCSDCGCYNCDCPVF